MHGLPRYPVGEGALSHEGGAYCVEVNIRYGLNIQGLPRHSVGEGALSHEGGTSCEEVNYITAYTYSVFYSF